MEQTLSNKAMLIKLNISQWTARKYDKSVSQKVANDYNSNSDMGRYNKSLIAKEALNEIKRISGKARTYHYENTLPWDDSGARLLPSKHYMEYSQKMRDFNQQFNNAVDDFEKNYPQFIDDARIKLNGLFNPSEYPSVGEIRDKFTIRVHVDPFPEADDFRVSLQAGEVERVKAFINERNRRAVEMANKELWERLFKAVSAMVDRLSDKDAVFRDSLVGNVVELCQLLPALNITDDQELDQMRQIVETKLAGLSPDALRKDERQRKQAANAANEILSNMKGKFGWGQVADVSSNDKAE